MKQLIEKLENVKIVLYNLDQYDEVGVVDDAIQALSQSEGELQKVKAVQDESSHWYVIPENLLPFFRIDEEDETMIDSGQFDDKWGKYRTGGDLNLIQLYARITP